MLTFVLATTRTIQMTLGGYRMDIVFPGELIVELKACESLLPVHEAQLLTYLKLTKTKLGLLINFNVPLLKNGIKRFAL